MKSKLYIFFGLIGAVIVTLSMVAVAQLESGGNYYYLPNSAYVLVNAHGDCYQLRQTCSAATMFAPTKTMSEWISVRDNSPACIAKTNMGSCYCVSCSTSSFSQG